MLSRRFDELMAELLRAYVAYHRLPRSPETVTQLAHARFYLEDVRRDIAEEREAIFTPPDVYVDESESTASASRSMSDSSL